MPSAAQDVGRTMKRFVTGVTGLAVISVALVAGDCWDDDDCDWDDDCDVIIVVPPSSVAGRPPDLNLDGFGDLVVGAPLHDGGGGPNARRGAVFIYFGSAPGPSATPDITIFGQEDRAEFGSSIAYVGDVNARGAP